MRSVLVLALSVPLMACGTTVINEGTGTGGGGGTTSSTSTTSTSAGGASSTGSGMSGDWETLIEGDWTLPSGSEGYFCVVATVPEEMFIKAFRPIAPDGTHHTVLTKGSAGQDGIFPCDAGTNGENMIYGSGVGTEAMDLPDGVAMKLEAGDKLLLNLHLYNVNASELGGTSGIEVLRANPSEVEHEAAATLAGTFNILIPPMSAGSAVGRCTLPQGANVFAVGPHMHQLGTHMTVTAKPQGVADVVLHDDAYSFESQKGYPIAPIMNLGPGDQVEIACSYNNTTDATVTFGDSSDQEMCFATLWAYPPPNTGFICSD